MWMSVRNKQGSVRETVAWFGQMVLPLHALVITLRLLNSCQSAGAMQIQSRYKIKLFDT